MGKGLQFRTLNRLFKLSYG